MKNTVLTIVILLLITGAGASGYYFGKGSSENHQPQQEEKVNADDKENKIKHWVAPMDPTFIRSVPGKSPMGMDLIPVYEGEEGKKNTEGLISIDPVTVQNMGVRTAVVHERLLSRKIRTVGVVEYDEKSVIQVHSKVEGWIEKLYVDFTGQSVKKDEILLEIYSPQLVSSQEEYLVALELKEKLGKSTYSEVAGGADSLLKSARKRLDYLDVPQHQIEELEKKRRIMKTLHIHSPGKGIVTKKHIQEGGYIKPGMPIYTIADISKVWVHADIYESELPWVKTGQPVNMTLAYYPGKVFEGKVSYIYPFLEAKSRTIKVRLEFDNPDWQLKPDMYANIEIASLIEGESVALPSEALIRSGERNVVITKTEKGKFLPKNVIIGIESGDGYYQVLEGLIDGEIVVTSAQFLIDSESRLKEAIAKMQKITNGDSDDNLSIEGMDMSDMSLDDDMDMSEMTLE